VLNEKKALRDTSFVKRKRRKELKRIGPFFFFGTGGAREEEVGEGLERVGGLENEGRADFLEAGKVRLREGLG